MGLCSIQLVLEQSSARIARVPEIRLIYPPDFPDTFIRVHFLKKYLDTFSKMFIHDRRIRIRACIRDRRIWIEFSILGVELCSRATNKLWGQQCKSSRIISWRARGKISFARVNRLWRQHVPIFFRRFRCIAFLALLILFCFLCQTRIVDARYELLKNPICTQTHTHAHTLGLKVKL